MHTRVGGVMFSERLAFLAQIHCVLSVKSPLGSWWETCAVNE
jgi:hypothetical protein